MTTTVIIKAHCSAAKEVDVYVSNGGVEVEEFVLQDGEEAIRHVYDDRAISVHEREKALVSP